MKKFSKLVTLILGLALVFSVTSCKPEVEIRYVDKAKTYAAAPTFTITQNDNGTFCVEITSTTEGATIYYSQNTNTAPAKEYKFAIEGITEDTYLSAIAKKAGIEDSPISYAKISVKEKTVTQLVHLEGYVAAPTFTTTLNEGGTTITVTMASSTDGAKIYYTTDGTEPTAESSLYNSAVTIDRTTTFKAFAVKDNMENSPVSTATASLSTTEIEIEVEKPVYISTVKTDGVVDTIKIFRQTSDGSSYELFETESKDIAAETTLSDIAADYKYDGFTARAMTQNGTALSLFYERNLITLKFLLNSGDETPYSVKAGLYESDVESVISPTSADKEGFHFNFWTTTGVTEVAVATAFPAADVTYIANWHPIEHYNVTYSTLYGTAPDTKQIDCHTPLTDDFFPDLDDYDVPSGGKRYFRYWKNSEGNQVIPGTVISENLALTAEWSDVNFIGQKPAPDAVGDIVFSDGSATPYTEGLTLSAAQKAAAVAVIFYNGTSTDVLGEKMLGVGIHNTEDEELEENRTKVWAYKPGYGQLASTAQGINTIPGLQCSLSMPEGYTTFGLEDNVFVTTFDGAIDGSSSWATLCEAVTDENKEGMYPAWEWVNGYAEKYGLTGDFAEGWYFPSIAELSMLSIAVKEENSVISDAISCVDGTPLSGTAYWSSNEAVSYGGNVQMAWVIKFATNKIDYGYKQGGRAVLAIRAFE